MTFLCVYRAVANPSQLLPLSGPNNYNHLFRATSFLQERVMPQVSTSQVSTIQITTSVPVDLSLRKRPLPQENGNQQSTDFDEVSGKRSRHDALPNTAQIEATPAIPNGTGNVMANTAVFGDHSIAPLVSAIATLLAQGERGANSVQILIETLTPDILAEIVIANMVHLPSTPPFYPSVNPTANWGQGNLLHSGPADIAGNPLTAPPMESAAASQPYPSAADPLRDLRKVCSFIPWSAIVETVIKVSAVNCFTDHFFRI